MLKIAHGVLPILTALVITVSGLSAIESNEWWIRMWDFPRVQILAVAVALAVAVFALGHPRRWPMVLLLGAAAAWQLYRIFPYTPLAAPEVAIVETANVDNKFCFSTLSLNVYQYNRDYARTERLIAREKPDILVLLETDQRWADALNQPLKAYSSVTALPLDNTYGIIVATRLPVRRSAVEILTEPGTPSVFAIVETRGGTPFQLVALHPRPPHPGQDTDERNAELAIAARRAARTPGPTVALGDFNDVAWSHTSRLFKRIGRYLDPRVGRGPYPTFPADWPLLRWPLDHVFITPGFIVRSIRVLEDIGSDHLPVAADLCLAPIMGRRLNDTPARADAVDRRETREILREYQEDTASDQRAQ